MCKRSVRSFIYIFMHLQIHGVRWSDTGELCSPASALGPVRVLSRITHTNTHSVLDFWCVSVFPLYKWKLSITCRLWASPQVANSSSWCQQREGTVCSSSLVIGIINLRRVMALLLVSQNETLRKREDTPCRFISYPLLPMSGCLSSPSFTCLLLALLQAGDEESAPGQYIQQWKPYYKKLSPYIDLIRSSAVLPHLLQATVGWIQTANWNFQCKSM